MCWQSVDVVIECWQASTATPRVPSTSTRSRPTNKRQTRYIGRLLISSPQLLAQRDTACVCVVHSTCLTGRHFSSADHPTILPTPEAYPLHIRPNSPSLSASPPNSLPVPSPIMPNFVIHARFTTRADKRDTFLAKYKEIAAQAKQHEKECLAFHLSEDPTTPNSFALFELSALHHMSTQSVPASAAPVLPVTCAC